MFLTVLVSSHDATGFHVAECDLPQEELEMGFMEKFSYEAPPQEILTKVYKAKGWSLEKHDEFLTDIRSPHHRFIAVRNMDVYVPDLFLIIEREER